MTQYITSQLLVDVILIMLAFSTLIGLLDFLGFLPRSIRSWIHRNANQNTIQTLQHLGFDIDLVQRRNAQARLPHYYQQGDTKTQVLAVCRRSLRRGVKQVGSVNNVKSNGFVDVMGASTNPDHAELIARLLVTHWRSLLSNPKEVSEVNIDFVVTPKNGSPIVGFEFAKLVERPLLLHNPKPKYKSKKKEIQSVFDVNSEIPRGSIGLVVDDSTTGGAKIRSLVNDIRECGMDVKDVLVLFEPEIKKPRLLLESYDLKLHSLIRFTADGKLM